VRRPPNYEAIHRRAAAIALHYPVTSEYVASLLQHFQPDEVLKLLDAMALTGRYLSADELLAQQGE
jgi:hypothetical protein